MSLPEPLNELDADSLRILEPYIQQAEFAENELVWVRLFCVLRGCSQCRRFPRFTPSKCHGGRLLKAPLRVRGGVNRGDCCYIIDEGWIRLEQPPNA